MLSRLNRMMRSEGGFTLVELLIVVIIVGILAGVGIPMYQGATERAKASEAVSALGTIKSALRTYYAQYGTYVDATNFTDMAKVTNGSILDVTDTDLGGRYFDSDSYRFDGAPTATTFDIVAIGDSSGAPSEAEVEGVIRRIDETGEIFKTML